MACGLVYFLLITFQTGEDDFSSIWIWSSPNFMMNLLDIYLLGSCVTFSMLALPFFLVRVRSEFFLCFEFRFWLMLEKSLLLAYFFPKKASWIV